MARYAHLPVGRLGADWMLDTADALFGRSLRDAGHLLWAADPALPDVAGRSAAAAADAALADEPPSMEVGRRQLISHGSKNCTDAYISMGRYADLYQCMFASQQPVCHRHT